jgi:ABC-type transport system involved in multi-copper enzyme maturation permease subunit
VVLDSSAVAIMVTFAIMIVTPILAQKATLERLLSSEWSREVLRVLYYTLPKIWEVRGIVQDLIMNKPIQSWMPIWSTAIFGAVILAIGIWRFQRRSY